MNFGIFFQLPCADDQTSTERYRATIAQCQLADDLGFDAVWLAELHFNSRFSVMPAPMMLGAAIAQCTERIKIGPAVNLLPLHHPIRLAEEAATLDVISGGRSIFGVGRGSIPGNYLGYGIDQAEGLDRFLEGLKMVLGAWTEEDFSYQGRYYQADHLTVVPRPVQNPHPPVYIASNSPETFEIVGSLGHNIMVSPPVMSAEAAVRGLGVYRRELADNGHQPEGPEVGIIVYVHVEEDEGKARDNFEVTLNNYMDTVRERVASTNPIRILSLAYPEILDEFTAVGSPERCAAQLKKFQEMYGATHFICWFNIGGMLTHQQVEKSMRLFAEKVMPQFV